MQTSMFTSTIQEQFEKFHYANPHIYIRLVSMANQAKRAGRRKIGMQMLFEVMRWNSIVQTEGDEFKLNNNYCAHYARKIMAENPHLDGIFEVREQRA